MSAYAALVLDGDHIPVNCDHDAFLFQGRGDCLNNMPLNDILFFKINNFAFQNFNSLLECAVRILLKFVQLILSPVSHGKKRSNSDTNGKNCIDEIRYRFKRIHNNGGLPSSIICVGLSGFLQARTKAASAAFSAACAVCIVARISVCSNCWVCCTPFRQMRYKKMSTTTSQTTSKMLKAMFTHVGIISSFLDQVAVRV